MHVLTLCISSEEKVCSTKFQISSQSVDSNSGMFLTSGSDSLQFIHVYHFCTYFQPRQAGLEGTTFELQKEDSLMHKNNQQSRLKLTFVSKHKVVFTNPKNHLTDN